MDRYTKAVLVTFLGAVFVLTVYFLFLRERPEDEAAQFAPADVAQVAPAAPLTPAPDRVVVVTPTPNPSFKVGATWLAGWWSEDGFCEGDAGETFVEDGGWGRWGVDGNWVLSGNRLVVIESMRIADTESGEPEKIDPPIRSVRVITNPSKDQYTYKRDGERVVMKRCSQEEN